MLLLLVVEVVFQLWFYTLLYFILVLYCPVETTVFGILGVVRT